MVGVCPHAQVVELFCDDCILLHSDILSAEKCNSEIYFRVREYPDAPSSGDEAGKKRRPDPSEET